VRIELQLNGAPASLEVTPQALLLDVLRDDLGLT
jgi:aerobic-type carbon monoxide dehydrogenase small subunit (CoxS/CutS family)